MKNNLKNMTLLELEALKLEIIKEISSRKINPWNNMEEPKTTDPKPVTLYIEKFI